MAASVVATAIPKRILVTGADGFVGTHLVRLLRSGPAADIRLLSRSTQACDTFRCDITDARSIDSVIAGFAPDIVYHLAGHASVAQSTTARQDTWRVNFDGTFNLVAALAVHAPDVTMLHVSSSEVYGHRFNDGIVTEDTAVAPMSPYARAKAATEMLLQDIFPETGKLVIVRPFNHTGPGQDERFVVPSFAAQIARLGPDDEITVGNLDAQREFLDVRDVVRAYTMLVDKAHDLGRHDVFNIASGQPHRIADILSQLQRVAGSNARTRVDPARLRPSDIPVARGSARKITEATGWSPGIPLDRTLADVLADARRHLG